MRGAPGVRLAVLLAAAVVAAGGLVPLPGPDAEVVTVIHLTGVPEDALALPPDETRAEVPELVDAFASAMAASEPNGSSGAATIDEPGTVDRIDAFLDDVARRDGGEGFETEHDHHVAWDGEGFDVS